MEMMMTESVHKLDAGSNEVFVTVVTSVANPHAKLFRARTKSGSAADAAAGRWLS
jgi:DNA invertase Pin-like site-specific DNA recombinase